MGKPIGPGPGNYKLPSTVGYDKHDASKHRNPQFSFGVKGGSGFKQIGPGPAYEINKVTAHGQVTEPAWSFGLKTGLRPFSVPGPGVYQPEKCPPMKTRRPPEYSFGDKLSRDLKTLGPGPNAYALKPMFDAQQWSMSKRLDPAMKPKSPGPAAYFHKDIEVYKRGFPKYTMRPKYYGVGHPKSPGPARYGPDLWMPGDASFKYSFGQKHFEWSPPMFTEADNVECKS